MMKTKLSYKTRRNSKCSSPNKGYLKTYKMHHSKDEIVEACTLKSANRDVPYLYTSSCHDTTAGVMDHTCRSRDQRDITGQNWQGFSPYNFLIRCQGLALYSERTDLLLLKP